MRAIVHGPVSLLMGLHPVDERSPVDTGDLIESERILVVLALIVERPESGEEEVPLLALRVHELGDVLSGVDTRGLFETSDQVLLGSHGNRFK
jgi:hypothetical protein